MRPSGVKKATWSFDPRPFPKGAAGPTIFPRHPCTELCSLHRDHVGLCSQSLCHVPGLQDREKGRQTLLKVPHINWKTEFCSRDKH
jgi:hypothetical protein